jgi:hypothetical protein
VRHDESREAKLNQVLLQVVDGCVSPQAEAKARGVSIHV